MLRATLDVRRCPVESFHPQKPSELFLLFNVKMLLISDKSVAPAAFTPISSLATIIYSLQLLLPLFFSQTACSNCIWTESSPVGSSTRRLAQKKKSLDWTSARWMSEISDLKSADVINYSNDVFVWSLKKRIIRPISCTCAFSVIASGVRLTSGRWDLLGFNPVSTLFYLIFMTVWMTVVSPWSHDMHGRGGYLLVRNMHSVIVTLVARKIKCFTDPSQQHSFHYLCRPVTEF